MKLSEYIQAAITEVRMTSESSDLSAMPMTISVQLDSAGLVCSGSNVSVATVTVQLASLMPDP